MEACDYIKNFSAKYIIKNYYIYLLLIIDSDEIKQYHSRCHSS